MTTISLPRLCAKRILFLCPDGSSMDIAQPDPREVDFQHVASALSKIARFTASHNGPAYSVAQHCVMGAHALIREGEDEFTAALFLLHDGHEYLLGDDGRPKQDLSFEMHNDISPVAAQIYRDSLARAKAGWDVAIYGAANLPPPDAWTKNQLSAVKSMDNRMFAMEAEVLMGKEIRKTYPLSKYPLPGRLGDKAFKVWGSAEAELRFLECFDRLIGLKQRKTAETNHLMYRKGKRS